jgi:hypothetical protein
VLLFNEEKSLKKSEKKVKIQNKEETETNRGKKNKLTYFGNNSRKL